LKQYRGLIIFFSAITLLFILVQVWHVKPSPEENKQERKCELKAFAVIMNAQSGKMLDESTRLDSVTYNNEIMRISSTLTDVSNSEIDSDEFAKNAKALLVSASCTEKVLGEFVKSGLSVNYIFQDSTSSPIVEFQIAQSDCL
jgi:hypothetical protein